jgi:hypothetical protein
MPENVRQRNYTLLRHVGAAFLTAPAYEAIGLSAGFLQAGVTRVIATLWAVPGSVSKV